MFFFCFIIFVVDLVVFAAYCYVAHCVVAVVGLLLHL